MIQELKWEERDSVEFENFLSSTMSIENSMDDREKNMMDMLLVAASDVDIEDAMEQIQKQIKGGKSNIPNPFTDFPRFLIVPSALGYGSDLFIFIAPGCKEDVDRLFQEAALNKHPPRPKCFIVCKNCPTAHCKKVANFLVQFKRRWSKKLGKAGAMERRESRGRYPIQEQAIEPFNIDADNSTMMIRDFLREHFQEAEEEDVPKDYKEALARNVNGRHETLILDISEEQKIYIWFRKWKKEYKVDPTDLITQALIEKVESMKGKVFIGTGEEEISPDENDPEFNPPIEGEEDEE